MSTATATTTSILLLLILFTVVHGLPMFLVTSGKPKCLTFDVPSQTMIRVHYKAPDIDQTGSSPTYITLLEKPVDPSEILDGDAAAATSEKLMMERRMKQATNPRKPRPVSQEIKEPSSGSFVQRIRDDSQVDVCIRASKAGSNHPMRFHIRIEELGDQVPETDQQQQQQQDVEHHWTFLEAQMDRIEHEMHTIIAEADFFKERDSVYHQQTDDLHKATLFWPILHVGILLITGFTQANHIVNFFKTRRII